MSSQESCRTEHIYVLFASQTGNAEQAAKDLCAQVPTQLSSAALATWTGIPSHSVEAANRIQVKVTASTMQLDDFLELEQCKWSRLMVIITSSYGVGQAPLGGYRFRDLCDAWLEDSTSSKKKEKKKVLDGVKYALCGLGDSKYTTFFRNPTVIDTALQAVGAERVGDLGKADASGTGDQLQSVVIEKWMDGIWKHLASVVVQDPLDRQRLDRMQNETIELCRRINPEFPRPSDYNANQATRYGMNQVILAIIVAVMAIATYYFYSIQ